MLHDTETSVGDVPLVVVSHLFCIHSIPRNEALTQH